MRHDHYKKRFLFKRLLFGGGLWESWLLIKIFLRIHGISWGRSRHGWVEHGIIDIERNALAIRLGMNFHRCRPIKCTSSGLSAGLSRRHNPRKPSLSARGSFLFSAQWKVNICLMINWKAPTAATSVRHSRQDVHKPLSNHRRCPRRCQNVFEGIEEFFGHYLLHENFRWISKHYCPKLIENREQTIRKRELIRLTRAADSWADGSAYLYKYTSKYQIMDSSAWAHSSLELSPQGLHRLLSIGFASRCSVTNFQDKTPILASSSRQIAYVPQ